MQQAHDVTEFSVTFMDGLSQQCLCLMMQIYDSAQVALTSTITAYFINKLVSNEIQRFYVKTQYSFY